MTECVGVDRDVEEFKRRRPAATVIAIPRVGGLHHRYAWKHAA